MQKSKAKALAWSGTVMALLATFFHIIGFATPHWLESFEQAKSRFDRIGLWTACFHNFGYDRDQLGKEYDGCHWIYSYEFKPIFDWLNPGWFLGVQIMMTLVLIINIITSILLLLGRLGMFVHYKDFFTQFTCSMMMFLSGALISLSVTLFGIKSDTDRQWFPRPDQNYLAWSFGLMVVAGFFCIFSAMCLLFDSLRIRWDMEKKKAQTDPYKGYKMKPVPPQYE
ncbi:hypothetical protein ACF0H5_022730 [Mactra antiquata]